MTTSTPTAPTAQAHGRFIRGSVSKVRRVLDQIRGRTYRDALIMLEFMPYRSTGPITKVPGLRWPTLSTTSVSTPHLW